MEIANHLNLKVSIPVVGINEVDSANINKIIQTKIKSICTSYEVKLPFLVMDKITGNISQNNLDRTMIHILSNIKLADDTTFDTSAKLTIC